jgi:hypothetical protein
MYRSVGVWASASRRQDQKVVGIAGIVGIVGIAHRRGGEIGRRARLRIWSRKGYRFESDPRQNQALTEIVKKENRPGF